MNQIGALAGDYEGSGSWHDSAGKTRSYHAVQSNRPTDGGFEMAFTHRFDDGSVVEARFTMTWIAPFLFRVADGGAPLGHGELFGAVCSYGLQTKEAFVHVSCRFDGDTLQTVGSSTTNAEGLYIAWQEELRIVEPPEGQAIS